MTEKAKTMADVADKAIDKLDTFVGTIATSATNVFDAASGVISTAVEKYGPAAVDTVLWIVRVDAIQYLLIGWLMVAVTVVIGIKSFKWASVGRNWDIFGPLPAFPVIGAIIFGTFAFNRVTDVWQYTAIIKPELYLAKQVVDMVKRKLDPPPTK